MRSVAQRVKSSLLAANARHTRPGAASSLVVGVGITGNLAGYRIVDPVPAAIVGFILARLGWWFGRDAMQVTTPWCRSPAATCGRSACSAAARRRPS